MEQSSKEHSDQHRESEKTDRTCTDNTKGGTAMPADLGWDALKGLSCAITGDKGNAQRTGVATRGDGRCFPPLQLGWNVGQAPERLRGQAGWHHEVTDPS